MTSTERKTTSLPITVKMKRETWVFPEIYFAAFVIYCINTSFFFLIRDQTLIILFGKTKTNIKGRRRRKKAQTQDDRKQHGFM